VSHQGWRLDCCRLRVCSSWWVRVTSFRGLVRGVEPVSHHDGGACRCLRLCFEHV
jgi:hypothetical protein